jgi:hypothetical protein
MAQDAMNESRRIKTELSQKVLRANADLADRMDREGLDIEYSTEDDYLRVTIGQARPSIGISWPDEIYSIAMVDPDSHLINAVEAPFFMETLGDKEPKKELWAMIVRLIKAGRTSVYIPPREERERTERAFQGLVRA